jgi:NADPH2:quinone reductase
MRLEQTARPQASRDQVLIEIKAAGVNPVDTYIRAGSYGPKEFPFIPGFDGAGIVLEKGENIEALTEGQRVYISGSLTGTYADCALCKMSQVHPLPDSMSFEQGAALGIPYHTACRALFQKGLAKAGQTVLIHGASGGVGIAAIQFALGAGLKVIATAGSEKARQLLIEQGAAFVLDHHDPDHPQTALEFTSGQGVDLIIEMLANVNLGHDLRILSKNARIVVVGSRGDVQINPRDLMLREAAVIGLLTGLASRNESKEAFEEIESGLRSGSLNPVIDLQIPLAQAARAHHAVMEKTHYGKIVLIP